MKALAAMVTAVALLAASPAPAQSNRPPQIVYQIFVRSFRDSNGDRSGDLDGLRQSIPYLKSLGVTTVLLTPIQPSPFYHSYFATRFSGVDRAYGDMTSFRHLVRALHAAGLRLILDEEFQYVAQGHPWFAQHPGWILKQSTSAAPEPFPGLMRLNSWDGAAYEVATVNLLAPGVRDFFTRYLMDWSDLGVDGFRLDHMMDDLDNKGRQTDLFARFWRPIFARLKAAHPGLELVAEQADWGYGGAWLTRGGVDAVFAFPLRTAIVSFDKAAIDKAIARTAAATPPGKRQLIFIENHDTDRFASLAGGDPAKLRLAAAFDLFLNGTPLIYYGQELGMRGRKSAAWNSDANDIPQREAFRWAADERGPGQAIWYAGDWPWWKDRFNRSHDGVSVEEEDKVAGSLLNWYRRLIALRARPEWLGGDQTEVCPNSDHLVCLLRKSGARRSLMIANLSPGPTTLDLATIGADDASWRVLARNGAVLARERLNLEPWAVEILGGVGPCREKGR
ncbi:MAG TPA: alpha-amylase family glycosyl hydrolase [Caulobacteraceae bacterium]|jgi:glycosidase